MAQTRHNCLRLSKHDDTSHFNYKTNYLWTGFVPIKLTPVWNRASHGKLSYKEWIDTVNTAVTLLITNQYCVVLVKAESPMFPREGLLVSQGAALPQYSFGLGFKITETKHHTRANNFQGKTYQANSPATKEHSPELQDTGCPKSPQNHRHLLTHYWTFHCTPERRNTAPPTRTPTQASLTRKPWQATCPSPSTTRKLHNKESSTNCQNTERPPQTQQYKQDEKSEKYPAHKGTG